MKGKLANTVKNSFKEKFIGSPIMIASPGRINLIGEHLDYNNGFVFPAAIDKYIISALAKNNQDITRIYSIDMDEMFEIDLDKIEKQEVGSWKNYVAGILDGLQKLNIEIANFDLTFGGNIPIGAGLSSSAALENNIVFGLNKLFKLGLSKADMIQISLRAEHEFAGVKCGIMDQFSSMMGKQNMALYLNCDDLSFEYIPINLNDYELFLINSNVKHHLVDSAYNQRKEECDKGLKILQQKFPEIKALSNAGFDQLKSVKDILPVNIYNRCLYVIEENKRVLAAKASIKNNNWIGFGKLLYDSHLGLQHLYEVSCPELDFLVEFTKNDKTVIGSRMMGGGFGGCTLNLIQKGSITPFRERITVAYQERFNKTLDSYRINITDGTRQL